MKKNKFMFLMAMVAAGFTKMFQGGSALSFAGGRSRGSSIKGFNPHQYRQMMINRKKRQRIRNKIAKESRRRNRDV